MTSKKKLSKKEPFVNPNWIISNEYLHGKDLITPGMFIKFKYQRDTFKFLQHVINTKTNTQWIDAVSQNGYHSFYTDDLKGIIKQKVKRKRKND